VWAVLGYTPKIGAPFLRRQDMTGIWRVTHSSLQLPTTTTTTTTTTTATTNNNNIDKTSSQDEIVLRLNEDGTFDPYTTIEESAAHGDHLHHILGRGGSWEYRDKSLILAADRPEDADSSKVHDTLLTGKLMVRVNECLPTDQKLWSQENEDKDKDGKEEAKTSSNTDTDIDVHLSIPNGQVSIGRFMYPKKHKAFFDAPMLFHQSSIGSFSMNQLLGNLNARLKTSIEEPSVVVAKFHKQDFYGRRFYLTSAPHKVDPGIAKIDKRYDEEKVLHDFRVMPITFHSNNTFSAIGTEKILRGRFGIAGEERDRFWFQVSLFGAGRSAPGSVYSEGRLVSHDDQRGYVGRIQEYEPQNNNNRTMFFIEGEFYIGDDFKKPKKPNSMGTFTLQEIDDLDDDDEEDEAEDKEDTSEESEGAFQ
jgi:hypothetical protein